jgi:hypothetical protein
MKEYRESFFQVVFAIFPRSNRKDTISQKPRVLESGGCRHCCEKSQEDVFETIRMYILRDAQPQIV